LRCAALGALVLCVPSLARADEFFAVRDENPLVRGYYLPMASDARAASPSNLSVTLSLMNTTNVDERGDERYLIDGEALTLRITYEHALTDDLHYRLTLPIIHDSGGFMDGLIEDWHRWFGFSRGYRPYYPKNQLDYSYSGLSTINLTHDQTNIGGLAGDLGYFAFDGEHQTVSLWGGLQAPTGSVADLTGDGAWDGAAWAHYAWRGIRWQVGSELGVVEPFGDELFAGRGHQLSGFGRVALTREFGANWALRAQLDGQTRRVRDSAVRLTGPSLELSVGATRRLWHRFRIEMGFAEDAAVNTAPDITFFLGIRN
jgi:hypothetical protein